MPPVDEDRLIYRAHVAYSRAAKKAMRDEAVSYDTPSYRLTEVDWSDEDHPIVIIRNGYRVLAEYRWSADRLSLMQ